MMTLKQVSLVSFASLKTTHHTHTHRCLALLVCQHTHKSIVVSSVNSAFNLERLAIFSNDQAKFWNLHLL